jgi:hypothetical protein
MIFFLQYGSCQSASKYKGRLRKWSVMLTMKYDKQDQQGKAAFNERNPHPTQ